MANGGSFSHGAPVIRVISAHLHGLQALKLNTFHLAAVLGSKVDHSMAKSSGEMGQVERPEFDGLVDDWDSTASIRNDLRDGGKLVVVGDVDIKATVGAKALLVPVLNRMAVVPDTKLPDIEKLRACVHDIYMRNKQYPTNLDIQSEAWQIRKLLGFIKMKIRRGEVTTEALLQ